MAEIRTNLPDWTDADRTGSVRVFSEGAWADSAELTRRAAAFARAIEPLTGRLVGLALPSGVELIAAAAACLRAQVPFLLLDPDTNAARLGALARQAGLDALITRRTDVPVAVWHPDLLAEAPAPPPRAALDTSGWAYGVVTSGSTGEPKICVIGRESLALHTARVVETFGLTRDDVVLQAAVPGFDVWLEEVVPALSAGARLVTLPRGLRLGVAEFDDLLRRTGVTVANVPTSFWSLWLDWLRTSATGRRLPPALRLVVVGSEAVPAEAARRWLDTCGDQPRLLAAYGLSESTITNFTYDVTACGLPEGATLVPLGSPLPGCRYELRPAAAGSGAEELVLTGGDVQLGYLASRADGLVGSGGVLATGDLVRREDGCLHFVGRRDDQVKVRGMRVSPVDVELALRARPDIDDAIVLPDPGAPGAGLVAFVVAAAPGAVDTGALAGHLAAVVPAGAVPARIAEVAEIPRLPNGKVDRRLLSASLSSGGPAIPAGSGVQRLMSEVLGRAIGEDDDFFAHGGHSLLAVALLNRIEAELGIGCAISDVFAARTPRALTERLARTPRAALPQMRPGPLPDRIPLTAQQEVVWFHEVMEPGSQAYHCQSKIELSGPVDPDRLAAAFRDIVQAHAIYRTSFHDEGGEPYQVVHPEVDFALERVTLNDPSPAAVDRYIDHYVARPFDISVPSLLRALLVEFPARPPVLVIVDHHLVHDGYTFALLLRELCARYEGSAVAEPPALSYAHYAVWQQEHLGGEFERRLVDYWRGRVEDTGECLALSVARAGTSRIRRVRLAQDVVEQARDAAARGPATLFHLFVAALGLSLARAGAGRSFAVGAGMGNRRLAGCEGILGMFINVLPLALDIDPGQDLSDYVRACTREAVEGLDHQELPTTRLARHLPGRSPLFRVMLGFDDGPVPDIWFGGSHGTLVELTNGHSKVPLTLTVILPREQRAGTAAEAAEHIDVIWELDAAALPAPAFDDLIRAFERALAAVSSGRRQSVADALDDLPAIHQLADSVG